MPKTSAPLVCCRAYGDAIRTVPLAVAGDAIAQTVNANKVKNAVPPNLTNRNGLPKP